MFFEGSLAEGVGDKPLTRVVDERFVGGGDYAGTMLATVLNAKAGFDGGLERMGIVVGVIHNDQTTCFLRFTFKIMDSLVYWIHKKTRSEAGWGGLCLVRNSMGMNGCKHSEVSLLIARVSFF